MVVCGTAKAIEDIQKGAVKAEDCCRSNSRNTSFEVLGTGQSGSGDCTYLVQKAKNEGDKQTAESRASGYAELGPTRVVGCRSDRPLEGRFLPK